MDKARKLNFFLNVRAGDIISCRGEDIEGKVIRWVTQSNINHTALYIGNEQIIEALSDGIVISNINDRLDDPKQELWIDRVKALEPSQVQPLIDYAETFLHTKYDFIGLLGIFVKYIVRKWHWDNFITFWGKNKLEDQRKLWCSEYCQVVFLKFGIKFVNFDSSYVTPGNIHSSTAVINILY